MEQKEHNENEEKKATEETSEERTKTDTNIQVEPKKDEIDWKAKYLYQAAEHENFRKRMEREKEETLKYGSTKVLSDLLQVVDNFERTTEMLKNEEDPKVKNIVTGIDMVNKQFLDTLAKHGLQQIEAVGKDFDPHFHDAMAQEYVEGKKPNEVVKEFQKGYILNGRVIRPAKVVVASDKQ